MLAATLLEGAADWQKQQSKQRAPNAYIVTGVFSRWRHPNYLGEILEWTGWAIACWSLAGLSFAVFTFANLAPRALANRRWYVETFPDFPRARKALVPYLF